MIGTVLQVEDLNIYYSTFGKSKRVVEDVSFTLKRGEILGIIGESGAGKSTIGKAIMGLIEPPDRAEGSIIFNGKNILTMDRYLLDRIRWKKISMIFQASMNSLNPVQKIEDDFYSIFRDKMNIRDKRKMEKMTDELLLSVSLPAYVKYRFPHELSGGMRQRTVIALALTTSPDIVIADEPTTALDVITEYFVLSILKERLRQSGSSMIFITHDLMAIMYMANRVLVMEKGRVVESGALEKIINEPENLYTKMLVSTIDR
ncbi:MAG: ABC transporter ATP-binding protein [Candidatus Thermoplasmatota archaeon]|nr:ABC transporter ATP-binding protein [Candidatus Thermoplasmatota archaeon]MCL5665573.1 ABC transporter ATP-binding protein [Candidatus Thermoplasmatota archaeon]